MRRAIHFGSGVNSLLENWVGIRAAAKRRGVVGHTPDIPPLISVVRPPRPNASRSRSVHYRILQQAANPASRASDCPVLDVFTRTHSGRSRFLLEGGIDEFLPDFVMLFAPDVHEVIDWARGFQPRTAELFPESEQPATGKGYPDRLYEVQRRSGEVELVYLHVEFQSPPTRDFEERMFVYHVRLWLHLRQPIVSIALLADGDRDFRPFEYRSEHFETWVQFRFRSVKLLDFSLCRSQFLESGDPGKVLIAIKWIDLEIRDPKERFREVVRAFRALRAILKDRALLPELTRCGGSFQFGSIAVFIVGVGRIRARLGKRIRNVGHRTLDSFADARITPHFFDRLIGSSSE